MNILAYCDKRYERATRRIVGRGAAVFTASPLDSESFPLDFVAGQDVFYLDLHGFPGKAYLYTRDGMAALSAKAVRGHSWPGMVVIALACYLPETPFLQAFTGTGAVVIAGCGRNYGAWPWLSAAQALARRVIREMERGQGADDALAVALDAVRRSVWQRLINHGNLADALDFSLYR